MLGWSCLPGLMRSTWPEGISGSGGSHCFVNTLRDWHFHANLCVKERLGCGASYQIFHHREEEKCSYVAKTVDILVDCGEALPKVFRPLQHQISPLIRLNCKSSHVSLRWLCSAIGTFPKANNWLMTSEQKKKYHSSTATSLQGRLNTALFQEVWKSWVINASWFIPKCVITCSLCQIDFLLYHGPVQVVLTVITLQGVFTGIINT